MNPIQTQTAYQKAGFARHGISMNQAQTDPTLRRIMHMAAQSDQRRHARARALVHNATHQKGTRND